MHESSRICRDHSSVPWAGSRRNRLKGSPRGPRGLPTPAVPGRSANAGERQLPDSQPRAPRGWRMWAAGRCPGHAEVLHGLRQGYDPAPAERAAQAPSIAAVVASRWTVVTRLCNPAADRGVTAVQLRPTPGHAELVAQERSVPCSPTGGGWGSKPGKDPEISARSGRHQP